MNLGRIIYGLRNHKNISQGKLAEKAGITIRTVNRIENELGYVPSQFVVGSIAKVLDCPVPVLYMYAMDTTDCFTTQQKTVFMGFKPTITQMLDLIYNLPKTR